MSAPIQNLLDQVRRLPGLRAAGVFADGRPSLSRVLDQTITVADLEKAWRHLTDALEVSQHHRIPAAQMRWIFERVLVYCVRRSDGLVLGLIFGREPAAPPSQDAMESLFNEFRNLRDA